MSEWLEMGTEWVRAHPQLTWGMVILSGVTFLGTLIVVPMLLTWMPADYFLHDPKDRDDGWGGRHPALRISSRIIKNIFGAIFLVMGIGMLVLPGQGILTMLVGIALLDLPGKRTLEIMLLRQKNVHRAVDWLRRKGHRDPLQLPAKDE